MFTKYWYIRDYFLLTLALILVSCTATPAPQVEDEDKVLSLQSVSVPKEQLCGVPKDVSLLEDWGNGRVGKITIANDATDVYVSYKMEGEWELYRTDAALAVNSASIPQNLLHYPEVWRFPYRSFHFSTVSEFSHKIPLGDFVAGDIATIAAHARVKGNGILPRSAWGQGEKFQGDLTKAMHFSYEIQPCLPKSMILTSEQEGLLGDEGAMLKVQKGTLLYTSQFAIDYIKSTEVKADIGNLTVLGVVDIDSIPACGRVCGNAMLPAQQKPYELSIPAPDNLVASTQIFVALEIELPTLEGRKEVLYLVDTAKVSNGRIVTQAQDFYGPSGKGRFVFLYLPQNTTFSTLQLDDVSIGYVEGIVANEGRPVSGAMVINDTMPFVVATDTDGFYRITARAGQSSNMTAFDTVLGIKGEAIANVPSKSGDNIPTITVNVNLEPMDFDVITQDGIRNNGFESGSLEKWKTLGSAAAVTSATCHGIKYKPVEANYMAMLSTGNTSVGNIASSMQQNFIVPAGVRRLTFDYNFITDEYPTYVGSQFNDKFTATVITPDGTNNFLEVTVNNSNITQACSSMQPSPPNDDDPYPAPVLTTGGATGWRSASIDLSAYADENNPVIVGIIFGLSDAGDNGFDTQVLIDNIRFGTISLAVRIIEGANADNERIKQDIRNANEILSQAGLNVELVDSQILVEPNFLSVSADTTASVTLSPPHAPDLYQLAPSQNTGHITLYYTEKLSLPPSLLSRRICGMAGIATAAVAMADVSTGCKGDWLKRTLAHELGHFLIGPGIVNNLEHGAPAGNFMSSPSFDMNERLKAVLNREQSININRIDNSVYISP